MDIYRVSLVAQRLKCLPAMREMGLVPALGRSPGEGNCNPLNYSCIENPMDGGAWYTTVHGVAKNRTHLSDFTFTWTYNSFFRGRKGGRGKIQVRKKVNC